MAGEVNYNSAWEMLSIINGMRTTGLTDREIYGICQPDKNDPSDDAIRKTVKRRIDALKERYGGRLVHDNETAKWFLEINDIPDTIEMGELQALNAAIQRAGNNQDIAVPLKSLNTKLVARFERRIEHQNPNKVKQTRLLNEAEEQRTAIFAFVGPHAIIQAEPEKREIIEKASQNCEILKFKYNGREHTVCPIGIMVGRSNMYMVSCEYNGTIMKSPAKYIMEDISELKNTHQPFPEPINITVQDYAKQFFGVFSDEKTYDVQWRTSTDPKTVRAVRKYRFHPDQELIENPDGSITIKFHAGGLRAMAQHLFEWAGEITPLAPQKLIDEYKKLLKHCLIRLEDDE